MPNFYDLVGGGNFYGSPNFYGDPPDHFFEDFYGTLDPFATLEGMFAWDGMFIPEKDAYTDLTETTPAGNTDLVYRWVNQGGLNLRFSQATSANRPTYTDASFGDKAGLVFTGTDTMTFASNVLLTGAYVFFMVVKFPVSGSGIGPITCRNTDGGDDRSLVSEIVFAGSTMRVYTLSPTQVDLTTPSAGRVIAIDVDTAGGGVWSNTTKTAATHNRNNIDQVEIKPSSAFPALTLGTICYIEKSKLTGGDTDILAIINELKTLNGV